MAALDSFNRHCQVVARRLSEGKVIPFLGAGANLCERPPGHDVAAGRLPPERRRAGRLLRRNVRLPGQGRCSISFASSQYVDLTAGDAALFEELHAIFAGGYEPNKLHRLLAELPAILRAQGRRPCGQLVITTNYDDAVERAFAGCR